jgi:hypothetical protein
MNFDEMFPSKYVKASDLGGRTLNAKIAGLAMEKMGDGEMKPVVHFIGASKGLVLNKTNGSALKEIYGSNTADWRGKPVQLFPTFTEYAGKRVECIRLRVPLPAGVAEPAGEPGNLDDLDDRIPF